MDKSELLESLRRKGISSKTLSAFSVVRMENFIPSIMKFLAYEDNALPIGHDQTISQPTTIAIMLDLLSLRKDQKVLEIGCGSGYVLALISEIVGENGRVYGLDIIREFIDRSRKPMSGYKNIQAFYGDGRFGIYEKAPFDRILISAAVSSIPNDLLVQLKEDGIIVAPVGPDNMQSLIAFKKSKEGLSIIEQVPGFVFVKFI